MKNESAVSDGCSRKRLGDHLSAKGGILHGWLWRGVKDQPLAQAVACSRLLLRCCSPAASMHGKRDGGRPEGFGWKALKDLGIAGAAHGQRQPWRIADKEDSKEEGAQGCA